MPESLPSHITIPSDVLFREVGEEGVLLNLQTEKYFILDDVGARMWHLLSQQGDVENTVVQLLAEYDVDERTLRQDLSDLITRLVEAQLVTVEPA